MLIIYWEKALLYVTYEFGWIWSSFESGIWCGLGFGRNFKILMIYRKWVLGLGMDLGLGGFGSLFCQGFSVYLGLERI